MKLNQAIIPSTIALLTTIGVSTLAAAGTIRDDGKYSDYESIAAKYNNVGLLNTESARCSGTLVASQWVLTAGHCVYGDKKWIDRGTFNLGETSYQVDRNNVFSTKGWTSREELTEGYDIGLFKLTSSVTGIDPAILYTGTEEVGERGIYVGFGNLGTGTTGAKTKNDSGIKIAGENNIDRLGSQYNENWSNNVLLSDFDSPSGSSLSNEFGSSIPLDFEYSIAPGDSGGGMFINGYLAGVNSFYSSDAKYGSVFGTTRVSSYAQWIGSIINGNSVTEEEVSSSIAPASAEEETNNNVNPVSGANATVPEPSTPVYMLLLGVIFGLFRRRTTK
jgi:secreted trypsin-like serine protease